MLLWGSPGTGKTSVVRALGAVDVGQACVVQQGIVLAVEAVEGLGSENGTLAQLAAVGDEERDSE